MRMSRRTKLAILATVIGLGLIAAVVLILGFVDATAMIEDSKRCAPTIWKLQPKQWPKFIGCTMAAHEGLAGGLIVGGGAIWAAWLAYTAVQEQIAAEREARETQQREDRERIRRQQASAKEVMKVCILPAINAAAIAMAVIDRAMANPLGAEEDVEKAFNHLRVMLDSFGLRESVRDLAAEDRVRYLEIIGMLSKIVSVREHGHSPFQARLKALGSGFKKLYDLLKRYDLEGQRVCWS
jgi:hypothetical protein